MTFTRILGIRYEPKDIRAGSTIQQFEKFLTKVAGFSDEQKEMWDRLKNLYKIRNTIIHSFGGVENHQNSSNIRNVVEQLSGVSVGLVMTDVFDDEPLLFEMIQIDSEFCTYVISLIDEVVLFLCDEMSHLCDRVAVDI